MPDDQKDDALKDRLKDWSSRLKRQMDRAEEHTRERITKYLTIRRLYQAKPDVGDVRGGRSEPGANPKSRVMSLALNRVVEQEVAAETALFFAEDPNWTFYDPALTIQAAQGMYHAQQLLEKGHDDMGLKTTIPRLLRIRKMYGRVIAELYWHREWRHKREREERHRLETTTDPVTGEERPKGLVSETVDVYKEVLDEDRPHLRPVPLWRFFMDPAADRIKKARWTCVKWHLSRWEVLDWIENAKALGAKTYPIDETPSSLVSGQTTETTTNQAQAYQQMAGLQFQPDHLDEMGEYYVRGEVLGLKGDRRLRRLLVLNGSQIVAEGFNPYNHGDYPYLESVDNPEEDTAEGLGLGQLTENALKNLNESLSMIAEGERIGLYGVYDRDDYVAGMTDTFRIFPGRINNVQENGRLKRWDFDISPFQLAQASNAGYAGDIGGAASAGAQAMAPGKVSKKEVDAVVAENTSRLRSRVASFATDFYKPFLRMEADLYDQFLPDDAAVTTMVPYDGHMIQMRMLKKDLKLARLVARIKDVTDPDSRTTISRNLNQFMNQIGSFVQTVAQAIPSAGLPTLQTILPTIMHMIRKQAYFVGLPPDDALPPELIEQLKGIIQQEIQVQQAAQQMAAQQAATGGMNVPVATSPAQG